MFCESGLTGSYLTTLRANMATPGNAVSDSFSYIELVKLFSYFKNKNAINETLHKLDFDKLNDLAYILTEMKPIYEAEINKTKEQDKQSILTEKDKLTIQLRNDLLKSFGTNQIGKQTEFILQLEHKIKNGEIESFNCKEIHEQLINIDKNVKCYPLYTSYVRSKLYHYLLFNMNLTADQLCNTYNISRRNLQYYKCFMRLIDEFPGLLRITITFKTFTKYSKFIKNYIMEDEELKLYAKHRIHPMNTTQ